MSDKTYTVLESRGVIEVEGCDKATFLQGLVSNNVNTITSEMAGHGAFLTPQGKYLFDFFLVQMGDVWLMDCEKSRMTDFLKKLNMYKLRSKVTLTDRTDGFDVLALMGESDDAGACQPIDGGVIFTDPRQAAMGKRAIVAKDTTILGFDEADFEVYEHARITLGLPDASRDMAVDKALLLENGFDELGSVDFQKGCYMGQELTARTKHRGLVKKRLVPVKMDGPAPDNGTILEVDEREIGEMRTSSGDMGLALLRLDALKKYATFTIGATTFTPVKPDWAVFTTDDA